MDLRKKRLLQILMQNAADMGTYLRGRLRELQARYPDLIGEVRGKGLMIGVELIEGRTERVPVKALTDRLLTQAWRNGLLLSCGASTLRLMPPLTVSKAIVDEATTILEQSLEEVL